MKGLASRLLRTAVISLGLVASAADRLELLAPGATVSPDGFSVGVRRLDSGGKPGAVEGLELTATGAQVVAEPGQPGLKRFRVTPLMGAREVALVASGGGLRIDRKLPVGPPASQVSLKLSPAAPVKGRDSSAQLTIELRNAEGRPDPESAPPVLRANVGSIEGLERVGPGLYRARYVLPLTRYPEVAVVVAFSAWPHPQSVHGAFGALRVPLAASVELPGKTEGNADMSIVIAGQKFGPVRSAADGRFKLPVVVPPGYGTGSGTAVDRLGNKRTAPVDLMLPPTDQLACVLSPTQLPADGVSRARVLCATSDPYGNIATGARVTLGAKKGRVLPPRPLADGVVEFMYVAPTELSAGPDELAATWKQGAISAREELQLTLSQGPAVVASARVASAQVHLAGSTQLTVSVTDALGRPRPGASLSQLSSDGALVAVMESAPGELRATWRAPSVGEPRAAPLELRAFGPAGHEPARLITWAQAGTLYVAVTDLAGLPVPGQHLKSSSGEWVTDEQGVASLGPAVDGDLRLRHAEWPGLEADVQVRDSGHLIFPGGARPGAPPIQVAVQLLPTVPVNVRLAISGRAVSWWLESINGELVKDRPVEVQLSQGTAGPTTIGDDGHAHFEASGPCTVTVVDVDSQVMALGEVAR